MASITDSLCGFDRNQRIPSFVLDPYASSSVESRVTPLTLGGLAWTLGGCYTKSCD